MSNWLVPAVVAMFMFGLWGVFSKLSIFFIDSKSALIYQSLGVALITFLIFTCMEFKLTFQPTGFGFALLTGIAYSLGCLFYFIAANHGKIETVVTLTALYPAITMILSFLFLRESVTLKQWLGIALALFAIFLMSY